jgi:hypothetical protein
MSDQPVDMLRNVQVDQPKSTQGLYELPCGYLDAQNELHTEVEVREIDGDVEDMMGSTQIPPFLKLGQLIARCTTRVGTVVDKGELLGNIVPSLPIGDRVYLLIAVRRVTLGDSYPFYQECQNPNCIDPATVDDAEPRRSKTLYDLNLCDLEVKKMPDPMKRAYAIEVKDIKGRVIPVKFHVMTGRDENKIARFKGDAASLQLLARLDVIDGRKLTITDDGKNIQDGLTYLKGLSMFVREQLRDAFEAVEGGVDTTLDLKCPLCQHEFRTELRMDDGFFRPSAARRRSKTK